MVAPITITTKITNINKTTSDTAQVENAHGVLRTVLQQQRPRVGRPLGCLCVDEVHVHVCVY